ncbi:MAG: long-chain fatty acid--CoA ligase [Candidatus Rokuibacteriota bacterium]|nr:MAG: long-chain fatty acid--CoA ligase [Candidatus Rokubacteria bacterium]PYM65037.1 MAG: long-chain fatty acid--CoA ligase [Candidatus Rokubacteria bacterium]PYN69592.1 MAG: long-chain fatty acid--CoA ligase [Candidatus Rokubacteria bacterium]
MAERLTLPRLLVRNARDLRERPAIREKDRGIWQTWTWGQYHGEVRDFALGLAALGFTRGERLAVIGDNRPRLYWAQLAAQALGGVSVPVYQDSIARELAYVWNHAECVIIVAEDQEQVDKVLALRNELPALRLVVYDDPRGMLHYRYDWLRSFQEVQELGRTFGREHPGHFEVEVEQGRPDDVAFICYTSGTTGSPKGAMLTHANAVVTAEVAARAEEFRVDDDYLAYLPMAWVGDAFYTLVMSLYIGFACNCPESPETVQRDLRELGPTLVLAPPRIWENMLTGVQVKAADAPGVKRRIFERFCAAAERAEILKSDGKPLPLGLRLAVALGEFFVYGPVRDQLGLRRARWALTGGSPLGPDTFRFFRAIGVNLKQVYGSTETTGLVSLQPSAEANPTTAGRPCAGIDVRIAERGEVLVKSAGIFRGYLKNEEATREVIDEDGWFHTGDAGFIDPRGHLVIIDRAKDVGALVDGTPFAPQFIENKLKFSPYIREAVAFGHARPFVAAMIAIDPNTVGNWAERRGLPYTSYTDLSQKPEVRELIREEVRKCNATLPDVTKVRRFLLLTKDLDADDAEVTRTRKVRRGYVAEKYATVIDAFYGGRDEVELTTTITYEDGRQAALRSLARVQDAEEIAAHG